MSAAVFKSMAMWIIRAVSYWKVHKKEFEMVLDWVREAEVKYEDGMTKAEYVREKIKAVLKIAAPYLQELVLSLAVGYLGKLGPDNGGIHLGTLK